MISCLLRELTPREPASLLASVKDTAKMKLGSKSVELGLSVKIKDGAIFISELVKAPITLTFELNSSIDAKLAGLYRITDEGNLEYTGGKLSNGKLVADVTQLGKYVVLEYNKIFSDLIGHWAEASVKQLVARHVVNGTSETEFSPGQQLTRAQFVAMLVRALNLDVQVGSTFKDVDNAAWYAPAVETVFQNGLVNGKDEEHFAPNVPISREEMAVMMVRAYQWNGGGTCACGIFGDVGSSADFQMGCQRGE